MSSVSENEDVVSVDPTVQQQPVFHLNPAASFRGILDYSTTASKKLYRSATTSLFEASEKFNCEPDEMLNFLRELDTRAIEYGWNDDISGILWIPLDVDDPASPLRYLPREYGTIDMDVITKFERTYLGDTGKCTHFPYLIFSILKINLDHIILKNKFIFNFLFHLEIKFKFLLRHWKSYKFPVSWLVDKNIGIISFANGFNLIPMTFDLIEALF